MNTNLEQESPQAYQTKSKANLIIYIIVIIIIIITFFIGIVVGLNKQISDINGLGDVSSTGRVLNTDSLPDYLTKDVNFKIFWKVWDIIKNKYVDRDQITDAQLFYGALRGAVASLNDPYSIFLNPEGSKEFNDELNGKFEGIGAEIGMRNDILTIISPLQDSPAEKAGLKSLDKIMEIDGINTIGMSLDQAVNLIRGDKGTEVILTIARDGVNEFKKITVIRDTIKIKSVTLQDKEGYSYIKVTNFNSDTSSAFFDIVNQVIQQSPKGIILDLRNNPGGFLDTAIDLSGYWVPKEEIVVKEEFNDPDLNQNFFSSGNAQLKEFNTVILVNQGSASASEIVSGALQDHELATIVGETTFGKGSVQELEKLSDGSSIKITISRWVTPFGRTIDKNGIIPDIEIELTQENYDNGEDPQLDKALEILNNNLEF